MGAAVVRELSVTEFRGIRRLARPLELGSSSVPVGRDGVGKAAVLEALYLLTMLYGVSEPP